VAKKSVKPKSKKAKKEAKETAKEGFDGFQGGLSVKLNRKLEDKRTLRDALSSHLTEVLDQELRNQEGRIAKLKKWEDQYKGIKPAKNFPFDKASNISAPLSRSNTDGIFVRLFNTIHGRKKIVLVSANKPEFVGIDREVEGAFNYFLRNELKFKEKVFDPLMECVKTGTGIIKIGWKEERDAVYAYATPEEEKDEHTYALQNTDAKAIKYVETAYSGPYIYPIARKDFVISSDAKSIQDAYICGFRKYYRRPQIELKTRIKNSLGDPMYDPKEVEKITQPDQYDEQEEDKAARQDKELTKTDSEKPYEIWELWLSYDVDEDGEEDDIVVTFHKDSGAILRCIYNPLFKKFRPFVDFKFYPVEYAFDGEGVCEILEPIQNGLDTMINQRIDSVTLANAPLIFVRPGLGISDYKMAPGKAIPIEGGDLQNDIRIERFPGPLPQSYEEEDRLVAYGDRAIGMTPEARGMSTSDSPVVKEAAVKLQEVGRKFQSGFNHVWSKFTDTFYIILEFFAQYQPEYTYQERTAKGQFDRKKIVEFPTKFIRQSLNLEMAAASELMNQDERLQRSLTLFTLLGDYMTKMASMAQAFTSPEVPVAFKQIILDGNDISARILRMILDDFDIKNIDELILDFRESLGEEGLAMVMQMSLMMPPEGSQPPGGGPPAPPQGQPPQ